MLLSETGNPTTKFYTASGTHVATGYLRVVRGGRGDYIEFDKTSLVWAVLEINPQERWRMHNRRRYYLDWRTQDESFVKVYEQLRTVKYADYVVGRCYIAPADLVWELP